MPRYPFPEPQVVNQDDHAFLWRDARLYSYITYQINYAIYLCQVGPPPPPNRSPSIF